MTSLAFDTHAFIKRLIAAGMPAAQAEAVTSLVKEAQEKRSERRGDKGGLRDEFAPIKAELMLVKWMLGFVLAFLGAIFAKLFFH